MEIKLVFLVFGIIAFHIHHADGDASMNLKVLVKDYFEWRMSEKPEQSTYKSFSKYNDILDSMKESGFEITKNRTEVFLTGLRGITRDELSQQEKISYDILENMLTTFLDGYKWRYYNTINPMNLLDGPQYNPSHFHKSFPFDTVGDFENYVARLQRFPNQLDEIITLFNLSISKQTTYHAVSLTLVFNQIDKICPVPTNYSIKCGYFTPFVKSIDHIHISSEKREDLISRAKIAIDSIVSKYQEVKTFLQSEYLPNTRKHYGVLNLENGREYYQACLKWYLSLDLTPEEVHQLGLREVERIQSEMMKIVERNNFNGTVSEYFLFLKNDSSMFFNTSEAMLKSYSDMIHNQIDPLLPKLFKKLPNLPIVVKAMTSDGPGGMYSSGSADGTHPGIFWANVLRPQEFPKITMLPLALHEASPGHHLQFSYNKFIDSPDFRSKMESSYLYKVPVAFPRYTASTEGWALYAESLGHELDLYKTDPELLGRYSSEMFRACRLVVDTGIHYYNWTKEEAIEYFLNYTLQARADLEVEIDRYVTWPGQACSYKIGELKIKELREKATKELGAKFDIRDFHTFIMEGGIVPLNLLERNVNEWIKKRLAEETKPGKPEPGPTCSAPNQLPFHHLFIVSFLSCLSILSLF
ncbi:hypothetical protein LOTGIDRAFT_203016 [Lottia gigantea]|uniref:DUF885 domain-containing protein n=1 Tax=Lottia gigantea TaxID=225164 RepID=V4CSX1_LOTGI|nr:hypothetical protein LOTGIDRAFT_203016 [Lottia gigantea]ESP05660.1 hypothetical protein LOTGIDRAFT_203016 [Lottia gigantea]